MAVNFDQRVVSFFASPKKDTATRRAGTTPNSGLLCEFIDGLPACSGLSGQFDAIKSASSRSFDPGMFNSDQVLGSQSLRLNR
jgi:hypothetical protein